MLTPEDRAWERYEARRKMQLDYNTAVKVARLEGEIIGRIHAFEGLLNMPPTPTEQLLSLTLEALTRLADELQAQVLGGKSSA